MSMNADMSAGLSIVHNGREIEMPWFMPTAEQIAERDRLLRSQFFLVRTSANSGIGESLRCRRCKAVHRFLTLLCIERPFSGLTGGIYAYYQTMGATGAINSLTPVQRARLDRMAQLIADNSNIADLAVTHPRMAASMNVAERDAELGAIALGVMEPISKARAQQYVDRINARGCRPKLVVEGLEDN
jgi:hypothetical protein